MESPKKQIPPSWDEIVRRSREESPPALDVRPCVRARLESLVRSSFWSRAEIRAGLLDCILELFARRLARISLGACFGAAAFLAIVTTTTADFNELTENELDLRENFDEALVGNDWTEYL